MNWKDYIKAIQDSDIVGGSLESIMANLFSTAGCVVQPSTEAIKSWLYGKRNCKSSNYFPNDTIKTKGVFYHFRNKPRDKLSNLQRIFEEQGVLASSSPIDVKTTDLDIFCWSLVNQFLDLLKFDRVDVPQPKGDTLNVREDLFPHNQKCCVYCIHWNGNRSIIGVSRIPADGTCHTYSGNRHRLQPRLSSTAACGNYKADQTLMNRMKESGYDVKDLI